MCKFYAKYWFLETQQLNKKANIKTLPESNLEPLAPQFDVLPRYHRDNSTYWLNI